MFNGFYMFLVVLMVLNCYLNRYGSIWTKFQLKPSIMDPNREIYVNWVTGVGDHSPRAQGALRNCAENQGGRLNNKNSGGCMFFAFPIRERHLF